MRPSIRNTYNTPVFEMLRSFFRGRRSKYSVNIDISVGPLNYITEDIRASNYRDGSNTAEAIPPVRTRCVSRLSGTSNQHADRSFKSLYAPLGGLRSLSCPRSMGSKYTLEDLTPAAKRTCKASDVLIGKSCPTRIISYSSNRHFL